MSEKSSTVSRPTPAFFEKREAVSPSQVKITEYALDMGEASREEGFRLNGCR